MNQNFSTDMRMLKMALKPKIKIANNLVKSEDGFYEGTIIKSEFGTAKRKERNGRDIEQIEYACLNFDCEFQGTNEPIKVTTQTGININSEPVEIVGKGRGGKNEVKVYNRFTTLLLALGIVAESELETIDESAIDRIEKEIDSLVGQVVRCKVGKNKDGFYAIDLATLELKK